MGNKNFVGTRLSPELKQRFDEHVESSGKKPADVIREAISSYLNFTPSTITIDIDWKTDLENRVKALEDRFKKPAQLGLDIADNRIDNSAVIDEIDSSKLLTSKELSELEGCLLKHTGVRFRHRKNTAVELTNKKIYDPVRANGKPRWKLR